MKININNREFEPRRIFCIGKNYGEHVEELGGSLPEEPVVFMKPVSSLVASGQSLKYPRYGSELHHEVEVILLIGKEGQNISEEEAYSYISGVTIGLDLTLRDIQKKLKKSGLPWELSKSFEQSAPIGKFKPYDSKSLDLENLSFTCHVNNSLKQDGNSRDMIFPIKKIIQTLSGWWTLQPGDIIYTGTPSGVGPLLPGDEIKITSPEIGSFLWNISGH
ncbi:MAG: fumarylacetoacetate hydrolase family protein [Nitrospinales bacterium]